MTRNIPKDVKRTLRKEVNFGCPINGCGSPYLSYHHFNPPWHIQEHHNPEGMIALCLEHHKQADNGAFTDDQLKILKEKPFLKLRDKVNGQFNWKREHLIFLIGGNVYLGSQEIYIYEKEKFIWLTNDEYNNTLLNFEIKSRNGFAVFSMRDNDWIISSDFDDIESIPSSKNLVFTSQKEQINIRIEFNTLSKAEFYTKYKEIIPDKWQVQIFQMIMGDLITICNVNGNLVFPFEILLEKNSAKINGTGKNLKIMGFEMIDMKEIKLQKCFSVGSSVIAK